MFEIVHYTTNVFEIRLKDRRTRLYTMFYPTNIRPQSITMRTIHGLYRVCSDFDLDVGEVMDFLTDHFRGRGDEHVARIIEHAESALLAALMAGEEVFQNYDDIPF